MHIIILSLCRNTNLMAEPIYGPLSVLSLQTFIKYSLGFIYNMRFLLLNHP